MTPDFYDQFNRAIRYSTTSGENEGEDADETPEVGTITCDDCGNDVAEDDVGEAYLPRASNPRSRRQADVCSDCRSDHYTQCDDCHEETHDDLVESGVIARGRRRPTYNVCQSCLDEYRSCPDCDTQRHPDDLTSENASGEDVCPPCGMNYFTCDECDGRFHSDDGDGSLCDDCRSEQQESDSIHDYGYRPSPIFHGDPKERHYGVELETVLKEGDLDDAATETLTKLNGGLHDENFAYLKRDSSLDGEGVGSFEIVTHPATLDAHKSRWPAVLGSNAPEGLISHDAKCCGLHVHVEKKGLSVGHIGKILHFVNAQNNRAFIEAIARRNSEAYAKLDPKKTAASAMKRPSSRYEAVNLQNPNTIEFRIFKGTLKPESFFRSLEFCDALVQFTRNAGLSEVVGVEPFADFVASQRKRYPNLYPFTQKFLGREVEAARERPEKLARGRGFLPVRMSVRLVFAPRDR